MAKDIIVKADLSDRYLNTDANIGGTVYGTEVHSVNGKTGHVILTAEDVGALPSDIPIPSLDGYATEEWVQEQEYATEEDIPTNVSAFTNDAGYLTEHQDISDKADKTAVNALDTRVTKLESGSGGGPTNMANGSADGSVRGINTASEDSSYTMGTYAFAEGYTTKASGNSSHAEGSGTKASGLASHAEGGGTTASGLASHAEGASTTASGNSSHAEGGGTTASGNSSHAEGSGTKASGDYSHAEGNGTKASGLASHAEGASTTASGLASHAEGVSTTASGDSSHAEGSGTIAQGYMQHVMGEYNVPQGTPKSYTSRDYVFIVGNGTAQKPSNAFAMKWDGTFVFANGTEITPAQFASLLALLNN